MKFFTILCLALALSQTLAYSWGSTYFEGGVSPTAVGTTSDYEIDEDAEAAPAGTTGQAAWYTTSSGGIVGTIYFESDTDDDGVTTYDYNEWKLYKVEDLSEDTETEADAINWSIERGEDLQGSWGGFIFTVTQETDEDDEDATLYCYNYADGETSSASVYGDTSEDTTLSVVSYFRQADWIYIIIQTKNNEEDAEDDTWDYAVQGYPVPMCDGDTKFDADATFLTGSDVVLSQWSCVQTTNTETAYCLYRESDDDDRLYKSGELPLTLEGEETEIDFTASTLASWDSTETDGVNSVSVTLASKSNKWWAFIRETTVDSDEPTQTSWKLSFRNADQTSDVELLTVETDTEDDGRDRAQSFFAFIGGGILTQTPNQNDDNDAGKVTITEFDEEGAAPETTTWEGDLYTGMDTSEDSSLAGGPADGRYWVSYYTFDEDNVNQGQYLGYGSADLSQNANILKAIVSTICAVVIAIFWV